MGPVFLASPARRATRRTIRQAPCRSSRWPDVATKIGSVAAFPDREVDHRGGARRERDDGFLAALEGDGQGSVAAVSAQRLDVGAGGLRYAQALEPSGSMPLNGSSNITAGGSASMAAAMPSRCRIPSE